MCDPSHLHQEVVAISSHPWIRTVPCIDAAGRHREMSIYLDAEGNIGISVPPGETARLPSADTARILQDVFAAAIVEQRRMSALTT